MKTIKCPKCKDDTFVFIYGGGWDYDRQMCTNRDCGHEKELKSSTEIGSLAVEDKRRDKGDKK